MFAGFQLINYEFDRQYVLYDIKKGIKVVIKYI